MKTTFKFTLIMALALAFTTNIEAQQRFNNPDRQQGQRFDRQERMDRPQAMQGARHERSIARLNLSEEQQAEMRQLRLNGQKEMLPLKNQLREKNAHLRTLTTAENYDENAVSALVEEIGELRTQMLSQRVEHRQEMRALLTEDQRVTFDTFMHNRAGQKMNRKSLRR